MAFGFAGAAAGAAESLDTLLAKRRAEALAQQELEQRRVTEERMRKATEQQIAASKAAMAAAARTAQRQEGLTSLSYIPAGEPVPQVLAQGLQGAGLGSAIERQETVPASTINLRKLPQGGTPGGTPIPLPTIPLAPEEWWSRRPSPEEREATRTREAGELAREHLVAVLNDKESTYADQVGAYVNAGLRPPADPAIASTLAKSRIAEWDARRFDDLQSAAQDDPRLPRGVKDYLHSFRYKAPPPGKDQYTYDDAEKEIYATWNLLQEDHPSLDISRVIEELRKIFTPLPEDKFGYAPRSVPPGVAIPGEGSSDAPGAVPPGVDPGSTQLNVPMGWTVVGGPG